MSGTRWTAKRSCSKQLTIDGRLRTALCWSYQKSPQGSLAVKKCEVSESWTIFATFQCSNSGMNSGSSTARWIEVETNVVRQVEPQALGIFRILLGYAPGVFRVASGMVAAEAHESSAIDALYFTMAMVIVGWTSTVRIIVFLNQHCSWYINHCRKRNREPSSSFFPSRGR